MKNALSYLLYFVLGMSAAAVVFLIAAPPRGKAIELPPAPSPAPIVIQVSGAVQQPGVYSLPSGSRVQEVIQMAGGLLPEADPAAVNLAARLKDGERVHVPRTGDAPVAVPDDSGRSTGMDLEKATPAGPVNINTASLEELQTLPGIGETKAKAIIAYREDKQGFKSIDELQNVTGIGPATFERLKDLITVE